MKNDEMTHGRRRLLRIAACLGAAGATRLVTACDGGGQVASAAKAPAAGPPAAVRHAPAAYRIQPMTGEAPPRWTRPAPPVRTKPFFDLPADGRSLTLSFDDGPDPTYTPQILAALRAHDVRAMFFVCGEMVSYYPDVLRRVAADGHLIGNHTWTHPELPRLTDAKIKDEMGRTSELIEKTVGTAPAWFRAPYGSWNRCAFEVGSRLGMEPLAWSVDTLDWSEPGTDSIVATVLKGAAPGAVVLHHDGGGIRKQTVAAVGRYLPELVARGFRITLPHP